MSVGTPIIDYIDGENRRIYLKRGVSDYYPIEDIYHEYRNLRRTDESLRKWYPLLKAEGNVAKGAGAFTPRYVVLIDGAKIVPYDESLQLNQLGDMITDDPDTDATLYDISGLTTAKPIFIKPSEAETIQLNSGSIEYSSFGGGVTVDVDNLSGNSTTGTYFPTGTPQQPVDNLTDAQSIAETRGFGVIYIIGNLTISSEYDFARYNFEGESPTKTTITIEESANVLNCEFKKCTVSGVIDGNSEISNSRISNLDFVDGKVENSDIGPDMIKLGTSTNANIFSCFSTVPGSNTPVIDMNGTGILGLRDYNGGIELRNYNGDGAHSIDMSSGQIKLDPATITSGTFVCRGVGKLIDASTGVAIPTGEWNGGVTIINELINLTTISEATVYAQAVYIDINGSAGIESPIGLERAPVNNLDDAKEIATNRGTKKFVFLSDFTFGDSDVLEGFELYGTGWQNQTITFNAGSIVAYCDIHELTLTGYQTGLTAITDCKIDTFGSVGYVASSQDLVLKRCLLEGTITLPSNYSGTVVAIDCYSDSAINTTPLVNMGNSTANIIIRNFAGSIEIANMNQTNFIDATLLGGEMDLRTANVINGTVKVVGTGTLKSSPEGEVLETGAWNGVQIINETNKVTVEGGDTVWTELEKDEVIQYSKKASDNAEQANLKL